MGLIKTEFRIVVQFSSVTQSWLTLCNPMDYSKPDFPVHHQLLELAQTHVIELVMPSKHQEASISLLSLFIRGQTEGKSQSQKTNQTDHSDHKPCLTQWNYEPCCVGPPEMDGSRWRVVTNVVHWRRGWQTTSVLLPWEPHEQCEKVKR